MQIEQFDTGLKGQENVKKLIISPEENFKNKLKVRGYLEQIFKDGISKIDENLENSFSKNIKVNCFYPLNEFSGLGEFKRKFWEPLFNSFPDIERREQIVIGGAFRDKVQVGSISTLSGTFKKSWFGISPNNKMINLKCCEIHELKNNKIIESHILIDLLDLMLQTGQYPLNKSRGAEGNWLNPINIDGANFFEKNLKISQASLEQSLVMQRSLNIKPELEAKTDDDLRAKLKNHPQSDYWHDKMIWYGPSGIGTARSLEGFINQQMLENLGSLLEVRTFVMMKMPVEIVSITESL